MMKLGWSLIISLWISVAVMGQTSTSDSSVAKATKIKPYKDVITSSAVTDDGLFKVHTVNSRVYFEIPNSLLERDFLTVNRISKAAVRNRPRNGFYGYAGDEIGRNIIRFSKKPNQKIFVSKINYWERSSDSSINGLYKAVESSNLQPVVASFDIKAYSVDSTAFVLDMTDFMESDNDVFYFSENHKSAFALKAFQKDKSFISSIKSFPNNIRINALKTYGAGDQTYTYELASSVILLPANPMRPRYADPRVGYFETPFIDFDANPQGVDVTKLIIRWRLEPKVEDMAKFQRGELVEPAKPIVFYIDPATPKKWVPYLIQGVNDWQKAFEKIGFKNAIYAIEAPNDPAWSIEDAQNSVIVYKASSVANAYGPTVADPRTGEILEAHIGWFHNVMELLRNWYMIQAGPLDARARNLNFDEKLMGQLIRFVSSHEVGHTLGLAHNFGSSTTIPVEKLRDKKYVEENGFCPSIMDYARFNYVAQPEDSISEKGIFPRIGIYDEWAIEYGYKILPQFTNLEKERVYLSQWITARISQDKRLWYAGDLSNDARAAAEDLGDDPVKAGTYGIKNLNHVVENLIDWTKSPLGSFDEFSKVYTATFDQYKRYINRCIDNLGGYYWEYITADQKGNTLSFVERTKQKNALKFVCDQVFLSPPHWVQDQTAILKKTSREVKLTSIQKDVLDRLLSNVRFYYLHFYQNLSDSSYSLKEYLADLKHAFWNSLQNGHPLTDNLKQAQQFYLSMLLNRIAEPGWHFGAISAYEMSKLNGAAILIRMHLGSIEADIRMALAFKKDISSQTHLKDMLKKIKEFNESTKITVATKPGSSGNTHFNHDEDILLVQPKKKDKSATPMGCDMWHF